LALVNGTFAGGAGESDGDSAKDVVARAFFHPFLGSGIEPLEQLGLGVGASVGKHTGTPDNPRLLTLTTYGGQVFFAYARPAAAGGAIRRLAAHPARGPGPVGPYRAPPVRR